MKLCKILERKPKWVSRQISDLEALYLSEELKKHNAVRALEIGSASGFSSAVIYGQLEENDKTKCEMHCFDLSEKCYYDDNYNTGDAFLEIHGKNSNIQYTTGVTSADITHDLLKTNELFDFLFIDANHRNPWAALDLLSLARFVKEDGIIGLDDITMMYNPKFRDCNGGRDLYRTWKGIKWRYQDVPNIGFLKRGSARNVARSVLSCLEVDWDQYPEVHLLHNYSEIASYYGEPYTSQLCNAINEKTGSKRRLVRKGIYSLPDNHKAIPANTKKHIPKPNINKSINDETILPVKSIIKPRVPPPFPVEFSEKDKNIFNYIVKSGFTMVSAERLYATITACKHVVMNDIEGDFVECGVWRGGVSIAAKMIFEAYDSNKNVHLFDTFAGMTEPTHHDFTANEKGLASDRFKKEQKEDYNAWCYASLEDVKKNFQNSGVRMKEVHFIKGDVLKTLSISTNIPNQISVLRLDTDWYESTKIELEVLYPILSKTGPLLIDDFGYWAGARRAVEEYFQNSEFEYPYLQYTDNTGRSGVKI